MRKLGARQHSEAGIARHSKQGHSLNRRQRRPEPSALFDIAADHFPAAVLTRQSNRFDRIGLVREACSEFDNGIAIGRCRNLVGTDQRPRHNRAQWQAHLLGN